MTKRQLLSNFLRENRALTAATLGYGLLASLLTVLLPISLGKYFELLFSGGSRRGAFLAWLPETWMANVPSFLLVFFAMIGLRTAFHFGQRYGSGLLGERFAKRVREQLFEHQLRISTTVYDDKGIGKFLLRYSGDMQSLQNYLTVGILQFAIDGLMLLVFLLAMAWLSPIILLTMLGGLVATGILVFLLNKKLSTATNLRRGSRSNLLAFVNERLLAAVTLKAFNKEVPEFQKFEKQSEELYGLGVNFQRIYSLIYAIVPGLIYTSLGVTLWTVYRTVSGGGNFDRGALLAFVLLFITVLPVLRRMFRANSVWEMGNISFQKLLNVLNLDAETQNLKPFKYKKGNIELRHLGFGFSKKKRLFSELNLSIRPGSITVLAAPNSFGKTTLVRLLMGIYQPIEGELLFDKQDVTKVDLKSLRKQISAVSDGFPLLGKTVFEAISYSRKPEKREKAALMLDALQAGLSGEHLLHLDKKIGERGIRLSAGQRKLLQYARAFLTDKPILIVDDPLADLPTEARINVVQLLMEGKVERTTVLLAAEWNDSWLKADEIIYLNNTDKPETVLKRST